MSYTVAGQCRTRLYSYLLKKCPKDEAVEVEQEDWQAVQADVVAFHNNVFLHVGMERTLH